MKSPENAEPFTLAELAEYAGVSVETARVFWRTLGFPQPGDDEQIFTAADVTALRQAVAWVAEGQLDQRGAISLGRSIAHTSERLVLWQVEAIVDDVARRLSVDDTAARMMALQDRKSTRLNSKSRGHLVCRLLLEKKKMSRNER